MVTITKGKVPQPVKGIVYGVEGIGKTTFAAKWPRPLIADVERGSMQLDVDRVTPETYSEVRGLVDSLSADPQGYRTLVIDSADWLEQMIVRHVCAEDGVASIEKVGKGYGKGWTRLAEVWAELLDVLDRLRVKQGMHVLFVGHAKIKRFEPADDIGHDRYTLVLNDRSADILKKWSDLTLFVKYDTFVVEEDGRPKVKGGDKRIMYTQYHPCWDAKNRYGLADRLSFEIGSIAKIFSADPVPEKQEPAPVKQEPEVKVPDPVPVVPDPVPEAPERELVRQVRRLMEQSGITEAEVGAEMLRKGVVPSGTPLDNYNDQTLQRIITGWNAVSHNIKTFGRN